MSAGAPSSQWRNLRADFDRYLELSPGYPRQSALRKLRVAVLEEPYWVIFWYRVGRWATVECRVPVVKQVVLVVHAVMFRVLRLLTGISIDRHCDAGPGLYFGHFGSIWINPDVRIGTRVSIMNGATIGLGGTGAVAGVPELGDSIFVGPNATIAGKLRVGSGAVVGANSLVVADVPEGVTVVGVPARAVMRGANQVSRDVVR